VCGPVEAVFSRIVECICGRSFIPDIVMRSASDVESGRAPDDEEEEEEDDSALSEADLTRKRHKAFLRANSLNGDVSSSSSASSSSRRALRRKSSIEYKDMSRLEKKIILARQRELGKLSCDILYERLDSGVDTYQGLKYSDWFKSSDLHEGLSQLQLSDRNLLLQLVISFVNSQTTVKL
jgi:hypothetical protein